MSIAEKLTEFRLKSGMSQREFAELLGIPQTTWSGYETGKTNPPMKVLFALAEKGYPIKGLTTPVVDDVAEELGSEGRICPEHQAAEKAESTSDMPIEEAGRRLRQAGGVDSRGP